MLLSVVRIRGGLRGDSAASTGDDAGDAHVVLGEVVGEPELLVMAMPGDQQVQAHVGQALVETFRSMTRLDTTRDDGFLGGKEETELGRSWTAT